MLAIAIALIVILGLAGGVLAYVAYPHRGERMPKAPWLGTAMSKAVDAAPTIEKPAEREIPERRGQRPDGPEERTGFFG